MFAARNVIPSTLQQHMAAQNVTIVGIFSLALQVMVVASKWACFSVLTSIASVILLASTSSLFIFMLSTIASMSEVFSFGVSSSSIWG